MDINNVYLGGVVIESSVTFYCLMTTQ